jgi:translation initiation factor IF-2
MTDGNETNETKGRLTLRPAAPGGGGHTVDAGSVRQSFSHGRSKVVQVEVRKKRGLPPGAPASVPPAAPLPTLSLKPAADRPVTAPTAPATSAPPIRPRPGAPTRALTAGETATRARVLAEQQRVAALREAERREAEKISIMSAAEEARRREDEAALVLGAGGERRAVFNGRSRPGSARRSAGAQHRTRNTAAAPRRPPRCRRRR